MSGDAQLATIGPETGAQLSLQDTINLGGILAKSGFFSDAKDASQAVAKIMMGYELGVGPMVSMVSLYIVQGKPTISAHIMAAAIKASPKYDYKIITHTDAVCDIEFFEGGQSVGHSKFTIENAQKAGTQNTQKFARNMLFARAMSNGYKWYAPDVFKTVAYVPEEMGATVNDQGTVITPLETQYSDNPAVAEVEKKGVADAPIKSVIAAAKYLNENEIEHPLYDAMCDRIDEVAAARKGKVAPPEPTPPPAKDVIEGDVQPAVEMITDAQVKKIQTVRHKLWPNSTDEDFHETIGKASVKDLSKAEAREWIDKMETALANKAEADEAAAAESKPDAAQIAAMKFRDKAKKHSPAITDDALLEKFNVWRLDQGDDVVETLAAAGVPSLTVAGAQIAEILGGGA